LFALKVRFTHKDSFKLKVLFTLLVWLGDRGIYIDRGVVADRPITGHLEVKIPGKMGRPTFPIF
jgi:hypothetical protein